MKGVGGAGVVIGSNETAGMATDICWMPFGNETYFVTAAAVTDWVRNGLTSTVAPASMSYPVIVTISPPVYKPEPEPGVILINLGATILSSLELL